LKVCAARANFPVSGILEHRELTPAKAQSTPSSERRDKLSWKVFSPLFSDLCVFAGEIPKFGRGCAALGDLPIKSAPGDILREREKAWAAVAS